MAVMTIPDYANLKKLPTGSTISLWDCRHTIHNEDKVESTILWPKDNENMPVCEILDKDKTYWFCAVTRDEYNRLLGDNEKITMLHGNLRKSGGWEQMIFLPTMEESIQWLAYHQSAGHTMGCEETIIVAVTLDDYNMCHNMALRKMSTFQRGYSVQMLQVHSPYKYKLTMEEQDNLRVIQLGYNAADKFKVYKWSNGWIWLYGHTMHLETMMQIKGENNHQTILNMALDHLGQYGQSCLPQAVQLSLQNYKATNGIDTFHVTIPRRQQKGHEDHAQYVKEKTMMIEKERSDEETVVQETKRPRTTADENMEPADKK
jgi:hypothetical protein